MGALLPQYPPALVSSVPAPFTTYNDLRCSLRQTHDPPCLSLPPLRPLRSVPASRTARRARLGPGARPRRAGTRIYDLRRPPVCTRPRVSWGTTTSSPPYDPAAPRTLVLCFDGTGDQFDSDVSLSTHVTSYATSTLVHLAFAYSRYSSYSCSRSHLHRCTDRHPRTELQRREILQPTQER